MSTDAPTPAPTPHEPFSLLVNDWSDTQHTVFNVKSACAENASYALVAVLTQLAISQWIWSSKAKRNHNSPVYLVSLVVFVLLWSMLMNGDHNLGLYHPLPVGFYIAVPLLACGGPVLNLLFCWAWSGIFSDTNDENNEHGDCGETANEVTPLLFNPITEVANEEPYAANSPAIDRPAEVAELGPLSLQELQPPAAPTTKPTIDYINNIKIFLTCLVIVFHMADYGSSSKETLDLFVVGLSPVPLQSFLFTEVCQSFFMSLFFFWSGYFSPRSLNKKGTYAFLFDKLKRLGIPWLIMTFVLGPYVTWSLVYVFFLKEQGISYKPPLAESTVAWFPQELIVFHIVFAFACGEGWKPKVKCPSLLSFFGISLTLGVLAGVITIFLPLGRPLFNVPAGWVWYPSYVVFFFGGALAQTNNWMDSIKDKSRLAIYCWAIVSVVTYVAITLVLKEDGEYLPPLLRHFLYKLTQVAIGIPISLAVTVFFHDFVNRKFAVTPFFSKAMYTAYLIQHTVPNWLAIKCWDLVLVAIGSNGHIGGGLEFAGWIFRSVMALILNWTLGYAIASIPGFSQVL